MPICYLYQMGLLNNCFCWTLCDVGLCLRGVAAVQKVCVRYCCLLWLVVMLLLVVLLWFVVMFLMLLLLLATDEYVGETEG